MAQLAPPGGQPLSVEDMPVPRDTESDYPPLMREQIAALREYAEERGPSWKTKLRKDWSNPAWLPLLTSLRNSHGPVWLTTFEFPA
jgi:hypothetical protein